MTRRQARSLWVGLSGTEDLFRTSGKLQLLVKTTDDAKVNLILWSGEEFKDSLGFAHWEQKAGMYSLVEHEIGTRTIRVAGRERGGSVQGNWDPDRVRGLYLEWSSPSSPHDCLSVEGLVFVPKEAEE